MILSLEHLTLKNKTHMKDKSLSQFVRDRKNQLRGLVVATVIDNEVRIGWSYTNTVAGDRFDKCRAYDIAFSRAEKGWGQNVKIPRDVEKIIQRMQHRATKYYKDAHFQDFEVDNDIFDLNA